MGIASLVLGIIGFLMSFSIFGDLCLILSVVGGVLGIISIVKKQNKGMAIAGVILCVIALIICFSNNNSTSPTTGTGKTIDTGNGTKTVQVSTENVVMEKAGITKVGDFVIKITNNNEGSVCLSSIKTAFKDESGNFALSKEAQQSFVVIPAHGTTYVYDWGFEENYAKYPTYEFSCELANIADSFVFDGINVTSNNTGKQIAVTLANNSGETITSANVVVLFYKGNEIVGAEEGYSDSSVSNGSNSYINVEYPKDSKYNEVSFDKYEVYFSKAEIY